MNRICTAGAMLLLATTFADARESAYTQLNRGIKSYHAKRLPEAKRAFENAVRMDPKCGDAYYYLGMIELHGGRTRQGVEYLKLVAKKWPTYSLAQERLGHVALRLGDKKSAEGYFAVAAEVRPNLNAWLQLGAVQLDLKKYKEAEASFAKATKLTRNNLQLADLLARLYMETKQPAKALDQYSLIIRTVPRDANARYLRGLCHQQLEREKTAAHDFQGCLELNPYHGGALRSLVAMWRDDATRGTEVAEYELRLERLKRGPPKVRRVSGKK